MGKGQGRARQFLETRVSRTDMALRDKPEEGGGGGGKLPYALWASHREGHVSGRQ